MRKSLALLGLPVLVILGAWVGCSGSGNGGGAGGSGGATSSTSTVTASAGGSSSCRPGGLPDGVCSADEDCGCEDCTHTAKCNPGQCDLDGICDLLYDACTCEDCVESAICADPTKGNCTDDGMCDSYSEGCLCKDCYDDPACAASSSACSGGKPDGVCDRSTEDCACADCHGTPLCVPCSNDNMCAPDEGCFCPDCLLDVVCNDATRCVDDGICDAFTEGCGCKDCKDLPECADAGTGTGGAGGAADAGP